MTTESLHTLFLNTTGAVTDTRKIEKDTMFFALRGENFNGNEFAEEAIEKGAKFAIVDDSKYKTSDRIITVNNCLLSLQELAKFHRKYINPTIIALTGSNGKTTTKELINAVLSKKYKTVATKGNLNNHIGVPLTLLSMDKTTEMGIVEMGANHLKEIQKLCDIATPNYGYITNFGKAHLEGFGGIEGVIKGKSELYDFLIGRYKTVFFNAEDDIQSEKLKDYDAKIGFSQTPTSDYKITLKSADPFVTLAFEDISINSNLIGTYNTTNIAVAITMGSYFEVPNKEIKEAIEAYKPSNNRSQIINSKNYKIILDAYNANPSSMKVALENFNQLKDSSKLVILGDMFELGNEAEKEHQSIATLAGNLAFDAIILVGENFYKTESNVLKFRSFDELKQHLSKETPTQKNILIKGSRGMALERVLDVL